MNLYDLYMIGGMLAYVLMFFLGRWTMKSELTQKVKKESTKVS